jgi:hypothetical protein
MSDSSIKRFWISWYGGDGEDYRPVYVDLEPEFPWWCSGERDKDPPFSICAVVNAVSEEEAFTMVKKFWLEAELRFCEPKDAGWMPEPSRFSPDAARWKQL